MVSRAANRWLKIEHVGDRFEVHWRLERHYGRNLVVDRGHSQGFTTEAEAQLWRKAFASALAEEASPLLP